MGICMPDKLQSADTQWLIHRNSNNVEYGKYESGTSRVRINIKFTNIS